MNDLAFNAGGVARLMSRAVSWLEAADRQLCVSKQYSTVAMTDREETAVDRTTFDTVTRRFARKASRRTALASLFGFGIVALQARSLDARTRTRRRRKRSRGADGANGANGANSTGSPTGTGTPSGNPPSRCYPGTSCTPGSGALNARCDFSRSSMLRGLNARGAVLSSANLSFADATAADFRGAALSNACLVGATLRDAAIDGSTVLNGAIFCRTVMPDGSINDRDCASGTECCPTAGL